MKRDEIYRENLFAMAEHPARLRRDNKPPNLQLPALPTQQLVNGDTEDGFFITPRAINGNMHSAVTPGISIGVATPFPGGPNHTTSVNNHPPRTSEEGPALEKKASHANQPRMSTEKSGDYFSALPASHTPSDIAKGPVTPGDTSLDAATQSPVDAEKEEKPKEGSSLFGKKFRMNFPKKLGRTSIDAKPPVVDEKSEGSEKSGEREEKLVQDNFFGSIQKIRHDYEEHLQTDTTQPLPLGITPSLPSETPELKLPPYTSVIIQEDRPDSGGVVDLYRGTVSSVGYDVDLIEQTGPMWLGDLLLRVHQSRFFAEFLDNDAFQNEIPLKDISKVSFVLLPFQELLPSIASADG